MLTFEDIRNDENIRTLIKRADESLITLGYTEHSFSHVGRVAETAGYILQTLRYPERDCELVQIAGWLHDIGNLVNRIDHAQSGAVMAFQLLSNYPQADIGEIATIVAAIGNHDESTAVAVNHIAAALIIGDKTDVRRSRVRNNDKTTFDIHDRVNYSVNQSVVRINEDKTLIELSLTIDTVYCSIMDYFEIFLGRMILCRKAAETLGLEFRLDMNNQHMI